MLSRTARGLETTLLLSRQSLPRPARLSSQARKYSSPSKPAAAASAAAAATQSHPAFEYNPFLSTNNAGSSWSDPLPSSSSTPPPPPPVSDMSMLFDRPNKFTFLPPPLPKEDQAHDPIFTDTVTQDKLAVMDACLFNLFNVPRAKILFDRLREEHSTTLSTSVYNKVIHAYLKTAALGDPEKWVADACEVYASMQDAGELDVHRDLQTYALMLSLCHRFKLQNSTVTYESILEDIKNDPSAPSFVEIVAHPIIGTQEESSALITELSQLALRRHDADLVNTLARTIRIANGNTEFGLPEAITALKQSTDAQGNTTAEVPFNIQNLRDHLAYVSYARQVLPDDMVARQRHLELSAYDMAQDRLTLQAQKLAELSMDGRFQDRALQELMFTWHTKLSAKLKEEVRIIEKEEARGKFRNSSTELTPYLSLVAPDRLSMIAILEVMRLIGTGGIAEGMKTTRAIVSIGKAVESEYKARLYRALDIKLPDAVKADKNVFTELGYTNLYQRRLAAARQLGGGESWSAEWSQLTRAQVGGVLLESLMEVAEVRRSARNRNTGKMVHDTQPAFYHGYEYIRGTKLGVIKVNPSVTERIAKDPLKGTIHPRYLPMLIPPKPWISHNEGAYLFSKASLMRFKESVEQEKYLKSSIREGNIELVMEGLNVLGRTPWKINKDVFDVVLQVWNSGERLGKMPPAVWDKPEPVPPPEDADLSARSMYIHKQKMHMQNIASNHSDRCSVNYKIEIARAFRDETIYFPHNVDFRGRAYPIPPHLNHMGDDLSRGLLRFAHAKPLGERGFRWLKIHLANLYGFDKADFNERVEWVHERLELIKDSARNPLGGERWWQGADDPWQCLATCFELTAALESGDPLKFESCIPVHQDGTCNGLQHYAAMGGDSQGAQQVNLAPVDRPSDVYTFVGKKVEKIVERDAAAGDKVAQALLGKITRKVVKQTVMTTVYGVTYVGAREQLHGQLEDRGDIPEEDCWGVASYLAKNVLTCIGDTFKGAKEIQNYLNLCARLVSKSISPARFDMKKSEAALQKEKMAVAVKRERERKQREKELKALEKGGAAAAAAVVGAAEKKATKAKAAKKLLVPMSAFKKEHMTSVIWTTALGLPIVQPYRKAVRKQVMTNLQSVFISDPNIPSEVNSVKQASAFPPNFVHSLDATHMLLSAIESNTQDITYAAVHDSYWTHACDIDTLSTIIRDTFIKLHGSDMLKRLHEEFHQRYKGYLIPAVHLSSYTSLNKKLVEAGVRVKMTREQAGDYAVLGDLIQIVEKGEETSAGLMKQDLGKQLLERDMAAGKIDVAAAVEGLPSKEQEVAAVLGNPGAFGVGEDEGEAVKAQEETEQEAEERVRAERNAAAAAALAEKNLMNKFVDITTVLPPLPEKGSFDVNDIRKSLYFFS